jgi:hypothetical protein
MAILVKPIKNGANVVALGELAPGDVAELMDGGLKFSDGTIQTTAAVTVDGVTSFNTRKGDVVAAAGDYDAAKITLDPTNINGVDATNVQLGIEQLGTLITETASDLLFMGLLGFDDADPTAPVQPGPSHYFIFNTAGTRTVGDATGVTVAIGDWLAYSRTDSKWVHLDYAARQATAAGTTYDPGSPLEKASVYLTATDVQAALDQADAELVALNTKVDGVIAAPGGVSSFNTRTGAVVPAAGDYTAAQTTFAATASITATDVQGAIEEIGLKAIPFFDTTGASKPIPLA